MGLYLLATLHLCRVGRSVTAATNGDEYPRLSLTSLMRTLHGELCLSSRCPCRVAHVHLKTRRVHPGESASR